MADEATIVTLLGNAGDPVEYTVASGTAIAKGALLKISNTPQLAAANTAAGLFCGIAATEQTGNDNNTKMAVITHCLADLHCGAGETMVLGGTVMGGAAANEVDVATGDNVEDTVKVIGIAQETVGNNGSGVVLVNAMKRR